METSSSKNFGKQNIFGACSPWGQVCGVQGLWYPASFEPACRAYDFRLQRSPKIGVKINKTA